MLYLIVRSLAVVLFKILFRLQAFGLQNIPSKEGFILASNHTSYLDPPALAAACPRVLAFMAKEGLFKGALFGRFISGLNTFPVKTHSGDIKALRRAIKILKEGRPVVIFPEGGKFDDGRLHKPLEGIGLLADRAAVPIIPTFIEGSNRALPEHSKFIRLEKIKVYFGRAIQPEELISPLSQKDLYQAIAAKTMEEIRQLRDRARGDES